MATFRVSANDLKSKADQLRALNAQFKSETTKLEGQEQSLVGMWEGEAKNSFDQAFKSDKIQMDNFYNAIEVYAAKLESAAVKYAQAENTNTEIAGNRTYR